MQGSVDFVLVRWAPNLTPIVLISLFVGRRSPILKSLRVTLAAVCLQGEVAGTSSDFCSKFKLQLIFSLIEWVVTGEGFKSCFVYLFWVHGIV